MKYEKFRIRNEYILFKNTWSLKAARSSLKTFLIKSFISFSNRRIMEPREYSEISKFKSECDKERTLAFRCLESLEFCLFALINGTKHLLIIFYRDTNAS